MFKTLHEEDKKNILYIQGSRIPEDFQDVSGIKLQNYDKNDKKIYDLASVVSKNSEDTNNAGNGELLLKTAKDGTLNDQIVVDYNGKVGIGKRPEYNLDVKGNASFSSVKIPKIHLSIPPENDVNAFNVNAFNVNEVTKQSEIRPSIQDITYGKGEWFVEKKELSTIGNVNEEITHLNLKFPLCSAHVYKIELCYRFNNLTKEDKVVRVIGHQKYNDDRNQPRVRTWHDCIVESHYISDFNKSSTPITSAFSVLDLRDAFESINFEMEVEISLKFMTLKQDKRDRQYGLDHSTLIISTLKS